MNGGEQETIAVDAAQMPQESDGLKREDEERAEPQHLTPELASAPDDGEWLQRREIRGGEQRTSILRPLRTQNRADIRQAVRVLAVRRQEPNQVASAARSGAVATIRPISGSISLAYLTVGLTIVTPVRVRSRSDRSKADTRPQYARPITSAATRHRQQDDVRAADLDRMPAFAQAIAFGCWREGDGHQRTSLVVGCSAGRDRSASRCSICLRPRSATRIVRATPGTAAAFA